MLQALKSLHSVRVGIFWFFVVSFAFGVGDRLMAAFADHVVSAIDIVQVSVPSGLFVLLLITFPIDEE